MTAAGRGTFYSGDGHLSDRGWFATPRYELDLGPVDLTRIGDYAYRLIGLPDKEFVAGFEIVEGKPNNDGGWGTYFTPKGTTTYTLTLSVVASQQPPQQPTRLLLRGGGWK